ncbi:MAG: glycogen debranching protein GlgX [Methylococcales bacterium]
MKYKIKSGKRFPAGATISSDGVNFSLFSRHATSAELVLYKDVSSKKSFQVIVLDLDVNRTFFFWHVFVEGLPAGVCYTWRIDGPETTKLNGFRFNPDIELVDPWAKAVVDDFWDREDAKKTSRKRQNAIRGMVVNDSDYDWEGDQPLKNPHENSIIYELHVGGFTRHPSSGVKHPGTFSGIIEKIPYLKKLGITCIELLPVMAFDEQDIPAGVRAKGLKNYWGYSTHSFFSPHPGYCVSPEKGTHRKEFRDMVKALHKAGISVILDVVFNHTAEGAVDGPTINFKGLGNEAIYHLEKSDRRIYRDYTGCGNTVNCNHPVVAAFIVECLEYWVTEFHIDGFRFDLASVLARGQDGRPMYHAPVVWNIEFSRPLAETRLIAEAWDAGGLYQVGGFPGFRWAEWNGMYRDVMRRFVRGHSGLIGEVATRLSGSSDLYQHSGRLPSNSINFVTCHDGFTLYDLVSYEHKLNHENGEENRDGTNQNESWNCGHEGPSDDPVINELRQKQVRNIYALLFLSQGVPMILAGDEMLRTQDGNNNGYCQDNEIGWLDWGLMTKNEPMLRFATLVIAFRKRHPCLNRNRFLTGTRQNSRHLADISWHGTTLHEPPWLIENAKVLAFTLGGIDDEEDIHVMLNMSGQQLDFELPKIKDRQWHKTIDTGAASPDDIIEPELQKSVEGSVFSSATHSIVILESRPIAET